MDYEKIYKDFIQNRRNKETVLSESGIYFEKHHIIPRCFGGNDSKSNLIKLTPEDHFFAHLLLAKIHGGKMIRALYAMSNFPAGEGRPDFSKRMNYGYIRKMVAKDYSVNYSGDNSPNSDKTIYSFINHDGRSVSGTPQKLSRICHINVRAVHALLKGEKHNYKGWYYPDKNNGLTRKQIVRKNHPKVNHDALKLYHYNGSVWEGTLYQFYDKFKRKLYFQTENGHCFGWYKSKKAAENHFSNLKNKCTSNASKRGSIKGLNNPNSDTTVYHFINFKTLEELCCTRYELSEKLNIKPSSLSVIFSRRQKSVRDWGLYEIYLIKDEIKTYTKSRHGHDKSRAGF